MRRFSTYMQPATNVPSLPAPSRPAIIRRVRLVTGLVLFTYVTSHLANHALGLFGLEAMEAGRGLFLSIWRNPIGSVALYGSITIHFALALWSLYQRRQLHIPHWEAAQLLLGLAIPLLLVSHAIGTRLAHEWYGVIDSYTRMILIFWSRPDLALRQALVLLIAWTHGCIGLHFWLRLKPWYPRGAMALAAAALLVPLLALLGFVEALRDIANLAQVPGWIHDTVVAAREPSSAQRSALGNTVDAVLVAYAAGLGLTLIARWIRNNHERRHHSVRISYASGQEITVPIGYTILEASRFSEIPHASVCGGRGRCSTCRVRIVKGVESLPPASQEELAVLKRVGAAPNVRLACQLRPTSDLSVTLILPVTATASDSFANPDYVAGQEREICVLFADLRSFTRFSERKLPYDVVFFLNRYFETMGSAIERAGGIPNQFTGDGVMALFGIESGSEQGCRGAIDAAKAMVRGLAEMSASLAEELEEPLRMGIGIHSGPVIVGHMGRGEATSLTAIGDTVHVASRLQDLTKQYKCQLIISESVAQRARIDVSDYPRHELTVRNRAEPVAIRTIEIVDSLSLSGNILASR